MGRRKAKKVVKKTRKIPKLDKEFNCPFCNHAKSIEVKIDRHRELGNLWCRVCSVSYSVDVTRHDEAIDVYSAWIDSCYQVNKPNTADSQQNNSNHLQLTGNVDEEYLDQSSGFNMNKVPENTRGKRKRSLEDDDAVDEDEQHMETAEETFDDAMTSRNLDVPMIEKNYTKSGKSDLDKKYVKDLFEEDDEHEETP